MVEELLGCILHQEDKDPGASWDTAEEHQDTAVPLDNHGNQDVQQVYHKHHTWAPQDSLP